MCGERGEFQRDGQAFVQTLYNYPLAVNEDTAEAKRVCVQGCWLVPEKS